MSAHSAACEWSTDPNSRCRCECKGLRHGVQAVRQRLGISDGDVVDEPAEETSNDQ